MAKIIFELNGARYEADSTAGPDRCGACEMPRRGKTCPWSMVCSNILGGAVFKRVNWPTQPSCDERNTAENLAGYYEKKSWTGD